MKSGYKSETVYSQILAPLDARDDQPCNVYVVFPGQFLKIDLKLFRF